MINAILKPETAASGQIASNRASNRASTPKIHLNTTKTTEVAPLNALQHP